MRAYNTRQDLGVQLPGVSMVCLATTQQRSGYTTAIGSGSLDDRAGPGGGGRIGGGHGGGGVSGGPYFTS